MKPDYTDWLKVENRIETTVKDWDANGWIHDEQAGNINSVIKKYEVASVLEIGCGSGETAKRVKHHRYTGYDKSEALLEMCKTKNVEKDFIFGDIRNLESVTPRDLVVCFSVLKHFGLHEWDDVYRKIITRGARLALVDVPVKETSIDDGTQFHHVWVDLERPQKIARENGFETVWVKDNKPGEKVFLFKKV